MWILPFRTAVPNLEISCSVDDDNQVAGSSLSSRGLVDLEITRKELLELEDRAASNNKLKVYMKKIPAINVIFKPLIRLIKRVSFCFFLRSLNFGCKHINLYS